MRPWEGNEEVLSASWEECSPGTNPSRHLDFGLPTSRTWWEKKFLLFKPPSVWYGERNTEGVAFQMVCVGWGHGERRHDEFAPGESLWVRDHPPQPPVCTSAPLANTINMVSGGELQPKSKIDLRFALSCSSILGKTPHMDPKGVSPRSFSWYSYTYILVRRHILVSIIHIGTHRKVRKCSKERWEHIKRTQELTWSGSLWPNQGQSESQNNKWE